MALGSKMRREVEGGDVAARARSTRSLGHIAVIGKSAEGAFGGRRSGLLWSHLVHSFSGLCRGARRCSWCSDAGPYRKVLEGSTVDEKR